MSSIDEKSERKVYLFKALGEDVLVTKDRFITHLSSLEIESQLVPVLVFDYSNLDNLWRYLSNPSQYAGMCINSIL